MNRSEIELFLKSATYQGEPMEAKVEETHISWIIFSKSHVFKIKKPILLSFLDFSSIEKRKHFCNRELILNQRFSTIYLEVLPVIKENDCWNLGSGEGEISDYAVLMERMDSSKRMDKMLGENLVKMKNMEALAKEVAGFHQKAEVIHLPFDLVEAKSLFQDLEQITPMIEQVLGMGKKQLIHRSIDWSDQFLEKYAGRIQERHKTGFVRDLHGDLHGGNIFLYRKPVLFDCIEFNDAYRQIDVLYEIAFLCMELEAGGHQELSGHFFRQYSQTISCIEAPEDKALYLYYKCLRANIRAKVLAIQEEKNQNQKFHTAKGEAIQKYLDLMETYINET
jgi:aminoglycoside phosphotransferase family enzyme